MWARFGWLVVPCLLLVTVEAKAQEPPPAACDKSWFKKDRDKTAIDPADLKAVCAADDEKFAEAMGRCAEDKERCIRVRADACKALTATRTDDLAKCYHAAGDPHFVVAPPAPAPPPPLPPADVSARAQAEGLAAAGAVSIIAQGVGDFLVQRAEQEVTLYAATELQKALCQEYGDAYFPKSCELLKQSDEDNEPVGLGVLRRAVVEDVQALPANVLVSVMGRLQDEDKKKACVLDVGYAFTKGVLTEGTVAPLLEPDPDNGGHLRLIRYRIRAKDRSTIAACDPTWEGLKNTSNDLVKVIGFFKNVTQTKGLKDAATIAPTLAKNVGFTPEQLALLNLWADLAEALNDVLQGPAPKEASARAIRAGVALLKELLPKKDGAAFDEAGAIAVAAVNADWIGVIGAVASAEHLGPVLLCRNSANPCVVDKKVRATLRLVGDVAVADSSEGVTAALERFAAPLGSWRRKYDGGWYLMANGYVGAKFAAEFVHDARPATTLAPVLAVGLELGGNVGSLARMGVFFQAVDLGNVSSVRLNEFSKDDPNLVHAEVAPDVTAAQLLAPGLFWTIAPWKAPFAVSVGADWVPELRTVSGDQKPAFHAGISLVVDTPITEIWHE